MVMQPALVADGLQQRCHAALQDVGGFGVLVVDDVHLRGVDKLVQRTELSD
jgi:hypothetical protein